MRFSLATTSCAIALALLAGCSASQNSTTLPTSGVNAQASHGVGAPDAIHGHITPQKLLELQAAGKLPAFAPRGAMAQMVKAYKNHPNQQIHADGKGGIGVWATDTDYSYLIGLTKNAKKAVVATSTSSYGGYDPVTVKVDGNQNAWVYSEDNEYFNGSVMQEYSSTGTYENQYLWEPYCGSGTVYECYSYGYDGAVNSSNVFAGQTYFYYDTSSGYDYGSGIFKFVNGDPSGTPTYIAVSDNATSKNCADYSCDEVYYMDVDNSGNIWFDFDGYNATNFEYGGGVGEVTSGGTVKIILPAGTLGYPGGVYVSGKGSSQTLNVIDQDTREVNQYHLPLTTGATPFKTIGPTKTNLFGYGDPVSGGFNSADTKMAIGDDYGWIDACTVSTNKCKATPNIDFYGGIEGAAYTPSDK